MKVPGYELVARTLKELGLDTGFFLMGAPMLEVEKASIAHGMKLIDVRHEQAAAMMAHAYSRVSGKVGVCMAASGPGVTNLTTGLANALIDCAPMIALGGSSNLTNYGMGSFQEIDQVAIMRPVTKWAERVYEAHRIPEYVETAYREALSGKPGPVYLDFPGDLLYEEIEESELTWTVDPDWRPARAHADPTLIEKAAELLANAEAPIMLSGSGALWSGAGGAMQELIELAGVPIFTTPQGRGIVPEDDPHCFPRSRTTAFREADVVLVVGTRMNYVFSYGRPPRFSPSAKFVRIDVDPAEFTRTMLPGVNILGDASAAVGQLVKALTGKVGRQSYAGWREKLTEMESQRKDAEVEKLSTSQVPIHPLRLCKEVRDFMDRDAVLCVDGQEILNYGRQSIPSFVPGHRLNSGPFGTMGVGMPFGLGAKAAKPDKQVIVLHGDGSFGMNGLEIDTAVRHKLPMIVVVSLNGGWTADPAKVKPGRDLGYTRFDKIAEALGCHAEYVEEPDQIRPALDRAKAAVAEGKVALVNVVTDWKARSQTVKFANYAT